MTSSAERFEEKTEWQVICELPGEERLDELRRIAASLNIVDAESKSKEELATALIADYQNYSASAIVRESANTETLSGESLGIYSDDELVWYEEGNSTTSSGTARYYFHIDEIESLQTNPYTCNPIPQSVLIEADIKRLLPRLPNIRREVHKLQVRNVMQRTESSQRLKDFLDIMPNVPRDKIHSMDADMLRRMIMYMFHFVPTFTVQNRDASLEALERSVSYGLLTLIEQFGDPLLADPYFLDFFSSELRDPDDDERRSVSVIVDMLTLSVEDYITYRTMVADNVTLTSMSLREVASEVVRVLNSIDYWEENQIVLPHDDIDLKWMLIECYTMKMVNDPTMFSLQRPREILQLDDSIEQTDAQFINDIRQEIDILIDEVSNKLLYVRILRIIEDLVDRNINGLPFPLCMPNTRNLFINGIVRAVSENSTEYSYMLSVTRYSLERMRLLPGDGNDDEDEDNSSSSSTDVDDEDESAEFVDDYNYDEDDDSEIALPIPLFDDESSDDAPNNDVSSDSSLEDVPLPIFDEDSSDDDDQPTTRRRRTN